MNASVALAIGILIGSGLIYFLFKPFMAGVLRVDRSDPYENPYLFLELKQDVNYISSKDYVILKVVDKNYISRD